MLGLNHKLMPKNKLISYFDSGKLESSSHSVGEKFVFFSKVELQNSITQIALGKLLAGECVPFHIHESMEEIFYILSGSAIFCIGDEQININKNCCIRVPVGIRHSIQAVSDFQFYYFGVITN